MSLKELASALASLDRSVVLETSERPILEKDQKKEGERPKPEKPIPQKPEKRKREGDKGTQRVKRPKGRASLVW